MELARAIRDELDLKGEGGSIMGKKGEGTFRKEQVRKVKRQE